MANPKLAVLGFFAFVIGIVLFLNSKSFIRPLPQVCGYVPILISNIIFEIAAGLLLLGGLTTIFVNIIINIGGKQMLSNAFTVIIILAVILGALFSFGVFSGSLFTTSPSGSACVGASGYLCTSFIYSHITGNVIVTIGQNSGYNYYNVKAAFVAFGSQCNPTTGAPDQLNVTSATSNLPYNAVGTLNPGETIIIALPVVTAANQFLGPVSVGSALKGTIWISYTTNATAGATVYYTQIASVFTRAQ